MAGHSKWHQIRHKKEITDKKRGAEFSKLIKTIVIAAKTGSDPQFNPRLRSVIEKARAANVPLDNIERALGRAEKQGGAPPEEIILEGYGPEGIAIIIKAATDNRNRTIQEIKTILKENEIKWAEPGSVKWIFEEPNEKNDFEWRPNFLKNINLENKNKILELSRTLKDHPDVQEVYTNAKW